MSEIHSPFLKDMSQCRSKSKTIRKKIYKYLMANNNHKAIQQTPNKIKEILLQKRLPSSLAQILNQQQSLTINMIDKIDFKEGIGLEEIRALADNQEMAVSQLSIEKKDLPCLTTTRKRRVLGSVTNFQSNTKRQLFFSTANQQWSQQASLQQDIPQISMFNPSLFFESKNESDQLFQLNDNCSNCQIDNRPSSKSNSFFEEPIQMDHLDFI